MRIRYLQTIAIFTICLMVSFPIYSASVFASVTTYSENKDGVRDYRAATDITTIVAEITESGVDFTEVNLITAGGSRAFTNACTFTDGLSTCGYSFNNGEINYVGAGKWNYNVKYTGVVPNQQSSTESITVDDLEPVVAIISISSSEQVIVNYDIKERAYENGGDNECSGINRVEFLLAGQLISSVELNFDP